MHAALGVLLEGGLRGYASQLPWEAGTSARKVTPEEEKQVDEYREFKLRQLNASIGIGKAPLPLEGEREKNDLWQLSYRQKTPSDIDRKVQLFINQQMKSNIGAHSNNSLHHVVPAKAAPPKKVGIFKQIAAMPMQIPIPHTNGSRYVMINGHNCKVMKFYHMHIPRTSGTSFAEDAHRLVVNNATLTMFSKEGCYEWKDRLPNVEAVVTMVRNPRAHVRSQFLYCSHGIAPLTRVRQLRPWVNDWTAYMNKGFLAGDFGARHPSETKMQINFQKYVYQTTLPFHCYSPVDLQVQHFTCKGGPFNYSNSSVEARAEPAIRNMRETFFVGVTEAYQESLCLFYIKVHDSLPDFCDCRNSTSWHSFNATRTSYYLLSVKSDDHDVKSWRPETRELVDNLTRADWRLYQAAVDRFAKEIHEAEQRFNTTIMCDDKLARQSRQEDDPAQREFSLYMREARATLKARH